MDNLWKHFGPIPKRMATQMNYEEPDEEETKSEDKNEDLMEERQNSPFPSKVLDTFKTDTITLDFRKFENVEEQVMVTLPVRMGNLGSHTQTEIIGGEGEG